ncbi:uncharacterized protein BT62DRAFT_1008002 [Guyanagaster necrorhizus]|uniref:Uncharacterized protein n=1 Tax=Guyanagaster necrorhizus TaxID=856835 RepID=A0A9P8AQY5_9AGAR|nr:uncharacterized protein BT62DRAFT_1008002 [Guyanagaster necrorhizus MCA 3950]KAG7444351.1 hypothetical protein BT62DRAFT_1008002 [Guyanagaster necrorhizus MCA 3950]
MENPTKARDDLDCSEVNDVVDSIKRKVEEEGLIDLPYFFYSRIVTIMTNADIESCPGFARPTVPSFFGNSGDT